MIKKKIRRKIKNFKNAHRLIKWKKAYAFSSVILMVLSLSVTAYSFYISYSNSNAIYEDIEIDPNNDALISLNFTQLDEMIIDISFLVENYHDIYWIRDISYSMELKISYIDKNNREEEIVEIFSDKDSKLKSVAPLSENTYSISATDGKDDKWDWSEIITFSQACDITKGISVLMDLEIHLIGWEELWLVYDEIDLSEDTIGTEAPVESNVERDTKDSKIDKTPSVYRSGIASSSNFSLILFVCLNCMVLIFAISRSKKRSRHSFRNPSPQSKKRRRKAIFYAIIRIIGFTSFFIVWDIVILFQLENSELGKVSTGNYEEIYQNLLIMSIFFSGLIAVIELTMAFSSNRFPIYSPQRSLASLGIRSLLFIQILLFALFTSQITYKMKDATLIVNSFNNFWAFIIILAIQLILAIVDLVSTAINRSEYQRLRHQIENERIKQKREKRKYDKFKLEDIRHDKIKEIVIEDVIQEPLQEEIRDDQGQLDLDLMMARTNPNYNKLEYCSNCEMLAVFNKDGICPECKERN